MRVVGMGWCLDLVILMSFSNLNDAMTEPPRGHQFYFRYLSRQQLLNVTLAWRGSFLLYVKWVKYFSVYAGWWTFLELPERWDWFVLRTKNDTVTSDGVLIGAVFGGGTLWALLPFAAGRAGGRKGIFSSITTIHCHVGFGTSVRSWLWLPDCGN